jgi:hypothetical protein
LTRPGQRRRVARAQRARSCLQGYRRSLRAYRDGDGLSRRAPLARAGQFIFGRIGKLAGRPGAVGRERPVPAAAGGAFLGIGREPGESRAAQVLDRRRRRPQLDHRRGVRHHHLFRLRGRAAGTGAGQRIAGIRRHRRRGHCSRGRLDAAPAAGRRAGLGRARAPCQGRRLTLRHRGGAQLQIDGGPHPFRTAAAVGERISLAARGERRDSPKRKRAAQ